MSNQVKTLRRAVVAGDPVAVREGKARYFKHVGSFVGVKTPALEALHKEHVGRKLASPWEVAEDFIRDYRL